jgi:capsular exopolysaccharide synthesis family protein
MAKVYDALRRAEEERKRRAGDEVTPAIPFDAQSVPPPPEKDRRPLLSRLRRRRRKRDGVAEVNKRRISMLQPDSYVAEQFRTLRGRIDAVAAQRGIRTVAVTSPMSGEGKTTAAVNLAVVTAMSVGRRVLLIDCDMRKPKVHQALGLVPDGGLEDVLTDSMSLEQAIIKVEGMNLDVLAVRGRPQNPSELLGSPRMRELIAEVADRYDRVIIDTPAALGVPDAKAVAELCDGIILVVRADVTTRQDVEACLEMLDQQNVIGMVLNGAQIDRGRYGYVS